MSSEYSESKDQLFKLPSRFRRRNSPSVGSFSPPMVLFRQLYCRMMPDALSLRQDRSLQGTLHLNLPIIPGRRRRLIVFACIFGRSRGIYAPETMPEETGLLAPDLRFPAKETPAPKGESLCRSLQGHKCPCSL